MNGRGPLVGGRRSALAAALLASGVVAVSGCTGPGADQAAQAAESFEQLAGSDAAEACDLLAPKTHDQVEKAADKTCPEALGDEDLPDPSPLTSVDVFGHDAIVRFANDTVFLARFPEGWRVTAAGCRPGPSDRKPYDCDVAAS
jgi:hypothetical protein